MTRAFDTDVLFDEAGNVLCNALGTLYADSSATTPVSDAFNAASGGALVTTVTTDSSGRWKVWFTTPKSYWIRWSDHSNTAYAANRPGVMLDWETFTSSEHQARDKAADEVTEATAPAIHTDFRGQPDGVMTVGDDGVPVVLNPVDDVKTLTVVNGKLQATLAGTGGEKATYWQQQMTGQVKRVGASFVFGPGDQDGVVGLIAWDSIIPTPYAVPDGPLHLVFGPTRWVMSYTDGGSVFEIQDGYYFGGTVGDPVALEQDNATVYTAEVTLDGDTATILLPDASIVTVTDPMIATQTGDVVIFELYRNSPSDATCQFVSVWADTKTEGYGYATAAQVAQIIDRNVDAPIGSTEAALSFPDAASGTTYDVAVPSSSADADPTNLAVTFTLPDDCTAVLVEMTGYLAMTGSTQVFWAFREGATQYSTIQMVGQQFNGAVHYAAKRTGMTPGTTHTFYWRHFAVSAGVATLKMRGTFGFIAVMKVTPLTS